MAHLSGISPSTIKNIMYDVSKNPGIVNINKIADGLGVTIREFYDSELFDELEPDD